MTAKILDGKATAAEIKAELKERVSALREQGVVPGLGTILVGDDPGSQSYVKGKHADCARIGVSSIRKDLPADTTTEDLNAAIDELNADPACTGYIVQLPLPKHLDENAALERIDPSKDADGLHPVNLGRLLRGETGGAIPCTPHGVMRMLSRTGNDPSGKHVVIVGRSTLVGRPLAVLLSNKAEGANATVTICHTRTPDIGAHTRIADIVVMAAGRPNTLTADMVRAGVVVVDVGTNRIEDPSRKRGWRLVGDADFPALKEVASWITPVPGGVGPMTRAMLLVNTVRAAEQAENRGN